MPRGWSASLNDRPSHKTGKNLLLVWGFWRLPRALLSGQGAAASVPENTGHRPLDQSHRQAPERPVPTLTPALPRRKPRGPNRPVSEGQAPHQRPSPDSNALCFQNRPLGSEPGLERRAAGEGAVSDLHLLSPSRTGGHRGPVMRTSIPVPHWSFDLNSSRARLS